MSSNRPLLSAEPRQKPAAQIDLSVVIPCFNEEDGIDSTIRTVEAYLSENYPELSTELLLINDGSTDNTLSILQEQARQYENIRIISFEVNKGRGEAIKQGIRASVGERLIMLDADLTYDVHHIGEILAAFAEAPKTDVVVVSPYMKGGVVSGVPFNRLLVSRCANWLLGGFFEGKLATVTCVVRGYRGDLIRQIYLAESSKELHLEILRKLSIYGANIKEIPGRLIWKPAKQAPRRKNNLKTVSSAKKHFLYGLMIRPTRYFKYLTALMFLLGVYEMIAISWSLLSYLDLSGATPLNMALRDALIQAYDYSPYSFFIMVGSLILGFQTFSFMVILQTLKLQQEETMRHLLVLLEERLSSEEGL